MNGFAEDAYTEPAVESAGGLGGLQACAKATNAFVERTAS
jgi:hypothetical protein